MRPGGWLYSPGPARSPTRRWPGWPRRLGRAADRRCLWTSLDETCLIGYIRVVMATTVEDRRWRVMGRHGNRDEVRRYGQRAEHGPVLTPRVRRRRDSRGDTRASWRNGRGLTWMNCD